MKYMIGIAIMIMVVFAVGCTQQEEVEVDQEIVLNTDNQENEESNEETENEQEDGTMNPVAVFETNMGNFKVELYEDKSPITAGNFKKLVEEGFYDGTRFHRVIADFMIQGGDPLSKDVANQNRWGTGDPGYKIEDEFIEGLSNTRGTLSMANSGPNSGGSQFFINVVDNTYLDWNQPPAQSKHPVFGAVTEGMDVVDKISKVATGGGVNRPIEEILITKVSLE